MRGHRVVAGPLVDLQRDEGGHPEPERHRIELRPEPLDHTPGQQLVQPGLHGAPGHLEPPGALQYADPGLGREQVDQFDVELVELDSLRSTHGYPPY
ncbi:hypothetical protein Pen02_02190 [Plantactinospora endophytica]|uniref:Uncharacterized protein n=1 Tax=Plantactinospora endophytica TaxID=673535 RepID=A0ABQ4DS46_9ACTN|nr:hypothetical protein Pen02_02190 [Plantactinospora endophytica]